MHTCLKNSGAKIAGYHIGWGYESELKVFRNLNYDVALGVGCGRLLGDSFYGKQAHDQKSDVLIPGGLDFEFKPALHDEITTFINYIKKEGIDLIKDPQAPPSLCYLVNNYEFFKGAKYVWMHRDPLEAAKSFIRLKLRPALACGFRGHITTLKAKAIYEWHEALLEYVFENTQCIKVDMKKFIAGEETKKIEQFLGLELNMDAIDLKRTFEYREAA